MHEQESREDYLEAILILSQSIKNVRSIDIANEMGFSKPSVSIAMKKLKETNLITMDSNGFIYLTKEGKKIAEEIYSRHLSITKFLIKLGVNEKIAKKDACLIEHDISKQTFDAIKRFIK